MKSPTARRVRLLLLALTAACASNPSTGGAPRARTDLSLITQAQIREKNFTNAYDAVQALRSNWLLAKGTDSFATPGQVQVYHDDTRLGGVETLRSIEASAITYIRYYDGIAASGRWGLDHGHGVIYVSSRPQR